MKIIEGGHGKMERLYGLIKFTITITLISAYYDHYTLQSSLSISIRTHKDELVLRVFDKAMFPYLHYSINLSPSHTNY